MKGFADAIGSFDKKAGRDGGVWGGKTSGAEFGGPAIEGANVKDKFVTAGLVISGGR